MSVSSTARPRAFASSSVRNAAATPANPPPTTATRDDVRRSRAPSTPSDAPRFSSRARIRVVARASTRAEKVDEQIIVATSSVPLARA